MTTDHRTRLAVIADLKTVLVEASRSRPLRSDINDVGEPAWVEYERLMMLNAVRRWRAELAPVDALPDTVGVDAIRRVEQSACGHVDYADKYAMGCAELVFKAEGGA